MKSAMNNSFSISTDAAAPDNVMVLRANQSWIRIDWKDLWEHQDLLRMLVRRDLLARYRQTVLGPIWFVLQPLVMAVIFSLVFARAARISTGDTPPLLFYLSSLLGWNFFSQCVTAIGGTFVSNSGLFGKVYFPRLIVPAAAVVSNLVTMGFQFAMFLAFLAYYIWFTPSSIALNSALLWLPVLTIQTALLAFGVGLLLASFTGRYRDLLHALPFLTLGWMFLTPVFFPLSQFSGPLVWLAYLNPMAPIVEGFRIALVGAGAVSPAMMGLSVLETIVVLLVGMVLFQRVSRTVVDTV